MSTVGVSLDSMSLPLLISDCLSLLIEPEDLVVSVLLPSVEVDPSSTVALHDSLHWHVRSQVEGSVDMETEFFVQSLISILLSIINVNDIPSLVHLTIVCFDNNLSGFLILGSIDIEDSCGLFDIDEL